MDKTHLTDPPLGIHWKPVDELTFSDDFIFKEVMSRPEIFKAVVNTLLPKLSIDTLVSLETEKPYTLDYYKHGVRFDLLARGTGTLVNMEMQVLNTKGLNERALYYLSSLVLSSLDKGEPYESLRRSIVIFFCKFDPFDKGRAVYEFSMRAATPRGLRLTDKASIFFYNVAMWQKVRGKRRQALFCYIMTGDVLRGGSWGPLAAQLDDAVADVKRNDKTNGGSTMLYETVMGWMAAQRNEGIAIGEKQGIAIGEKQGIAIGEKRGIAIGERRGIAIGTREKARETARRALECGIPADTVAKFTGLSVEEMQALL